jgi:hypothetical protein
VIISKMHWRHKDDYLGRYIKAGRLVAENCTNFSISGPDGTKVGTDLSLFCGHIMYLGEEPKVAVLPPQVTMFVFLTQF